VAGRANFGRMPQVLDAIETARAQGLQVAANVYPYTASANSLASSLPAWAREGGVEAMIARLRDPAQRQRILRELRARRLSAHDIMVSSVLSPELAHWRGQRLDEVARAMGVPVEEAMLALVEKDRGSVAVVRFVMDERDLQAALRKGWIAFGADSAALTVEGADPSESRHPRAFGTMARVLGHYARELGLFTMEEAVRRMTSLPAGRVGLLDRGLLRPGLMADVVVFDPARIRDRATYEQPTLYAEGVEHVIVNGRLVLESGRMTGERPGRPLRHASAPQLGGSGGRSKRSGR
jgi:N-acyl-D-aspartate/D-glutamate deacylase